MLEIVRILMDYEKDPAGVEEMPQFNWELKSDKRGVVQKAYQLQIAENRDFDTPVYDSGVTESCESAHIRPLHVELKSAVNYGVRVREMCIRDSFICRIPSRKVASGKTTVLQG